MPLSLRNENGFSIQGHCLIMEGIFSFKELTIDKNIFNNNST
jgi:hypothetical protein